VLDDHRNVELSTHYSGQQILVHLRTREARSLDSVEGGWHVEFGKAGDGLLYNECDDVHLDIDELFGYALYTTSDGELFTVPNAEVVAQ
jgi:hypothetical protein